MLFLAVFLAGCVSPLEDGQNQPREVTVSFAMSLKNVSSSQAPATKMNGSVVQAGGVFRGIEQLFIVPFHTENGTEKGGPVRATDERLGNYNVGRNSLWISYDGLVDNNHSHLYEVVIMPMSMNRVLTYGKVFDETVSGGTEKDRKHRNGVLNPSNVSDPSMASEISFCLEPIASESDSSAIVATADRLIASLNRVVDAIKASGEPTFRPIFEYAENQIWACSYRTFFSILENIQATVFGYFGPGATAIMEALNDFSGVLDSVGSTFPASYGIPEGCVGFWWNGKEFRRLINGVNIKLAPVTNYCYPPSLWYFANSGVCTSHDGSVISQYKAGNQYWKDILNYYDDGTTVVYATHSVALSDSLQYGVSLLSLNMSVSNTSAAAGCPLTGVIVGGQKDVDFEFKPQENAGDNPVPIRYVYDKIDNGPAIGAKGSASIPTLLLQTADRDSVYFVLEFNNTTTRTLRCQQGDILPGSSFYCVGKLVPPTGQAPLKRVFSQDKMTAVTIRNITLLNAYNTIPDLYDPQLEVGIQAEMDWEPLTPQSIKLNL
jgi:hypothetical protein